MEVSLSKTGFSCYNKIFTREVKKEATQDTVVPDTMPDISEIIDASGIFMIRSKEVGDGKVKITGNVAVRVIYKAEEEKGVCSIETSVPAELYEESNNIGDDAACSARVLVMLVEARALNPRKVLVRAELCAQIDCYTSTMMELCSGVEDTSAGIYVRSRKAVFSPVVSVREKTFVVTDELTVPAACASAAEILSQKIFPVVDDIKTVGSKLVFKGCIKSRILYRTDENGVSAADFTSNFSQIIECDSIMTNPCADVELMPTGVYFEVLSSGGGRSISMEAHMLAQAVCRERMEFEYLADAYSNTYCLELVRDVITAEAAEEQGVLKEDMRQLYETPEPAAEVVDAYAMSGTASAGENGLELPVCVYAIYKTADGELHSGKKKYTIKFQTDINDGKILVVNGSDLSELTAVPAGGGIELRLYAKVYIKRMEVSCLNAVMSIEYSEDNTVNTSDKPSLVILRANADSDLWEIAKDNCSSVEQIETVNGLRELTGDWEKYLLIPKVR